MVSERGFFGQENDVNRACSAFGLDTVNYRAFPNNGPHPEVVGFRVPPSAAPRQPAPAADTSQPAAAEPTESQAATPDSAAPEPAGPQPTVAPAPRPAAAAEQPPPPPTKPAALLSAAVPRYSWGLVQAATVPPNRAVQPSAVVFPLLTQALPATAPRRISAFSRARSPRPALPAAPAYVQLAAEPGQPEQSVPGQSKPESAAPQPAAVPAGGAVQEAFGLAFAAAYTAAFGRPQQ